MEVVHQLSDPAAWDEEHGGYLLRYALKHVRDPHVAQDLVQETWLAAWQARSKFAGRSSERTWLIGILRHKMINHGQTSFREWPMTDAQLLQLCKTGQLNSRGWPASSHAPGLDPVSRLEWKQLRQKLNHCLCRLSERLSAVFTSCDLEEMPSREVAGRLGITHGNLYVLLHRARRKIRECISTTPKHVQ
ncbi:MAG: sigma-70 family RNA polymerase sigma factor [Nitrospirota bacterium]|jgi:RNA polymerase sigma-70 factor (ECF subfamily)